MHFDFERWLEHFYNAKSERRVLTRSELFNLYGDGDSAAEVAAHNDDLALGMAD